MIKLLHTGDIHLDSPFSGLDSRSAEIRRNELRAAFTSMMTYARMNNADLILIAGDVFDGDYVTRETLLLLCREFENFGKPVFIAPGNHDSATPSSVWQKNIFPKNVFVFKDDEVSSVDLPELNTTVYGFGFTSPHMTTVPLIGKSVADPTHINLLLCHCDMVGPKNGNTNCPVTPDHLDNFGADYSALGHVHNPPSPGHDGRWCYPGCLEPRAFDETGAKGACMVEISKKNSEASIAIKRVRFAKRRYERDELRLNDPRTQADVRAAVADFISEKKYGEDTLLSLKLTGYIPQSLVIDTEAIENSCTSLFMLRLEDATRPDIDLAALESDITIKGEVYRNLKPSLTSSDEQTREIGLRALRYAMSALAGDNTF
ncbi:MAG: DNA repair exonuclease [Ruminococcaceae bacterium]|nr:DNA repair exonuclease [Oscillospiraceae bacterium]